MNKPNCYECKHRGTIPGDCHSCCHHPANGEVQDNVFSAMVDMVSGKHRDGAAKLNIKGQSHGVKNGWFWWPVNFDPVWLLNCDGFETKE